eukprot:5727069-Pyramimonas_sp.AAC.1
MHIEDALEPDTAIRTSGFLPPGAGPPTDVHCQPCDNNNALSLPSTVHGCSKEKNTCGPLPKQEGHMEAITEHHHGPRIKFGATRGL